MTEAMCIVTFDFQNMLACLTLTAAKSWKEVNGPDTRCGLDYYYRRADGCEAYINVDQGHVTISVDGETLFEGNPAEDGHLSGFTMEI